MSDSPLPQGSTCIDCTRFDNCFNLFGCKPMATTCRWDSNLFDPEPELDD